MIIEYIAFAVSAFVLLVLVGSLIGKYLRSRSNPIPQPMPGEKRPLTEYRVREGLTQILQLNRIVGDADIRAGEVLPAADPEKAHVFSRMLMGAYSQAKSNGLPSGANLYFAVPHDGAITGWAYKCFGDFGIGDAAAVAQLIDRQAAMISELRKEIAAVPVAVAEIDVTKQPGYGFRGPALVGGGHRCTACNGQGIRHNPTRSCSVCGGSGKIEA